MNTSHVIHAGGRPVVITCNVKLVSPNVTVIRVNDEGRAHAIASTFGGRIEQDRDGWKVTTTAVVPKGFLC
jgi:hypothetical protein